MVVAVAGQCGMLGGDVVAVLAVGGPDSLAVFGWRVFGDVGVEAGVA